MLSSEMCTNIRRFIRITEYKLCACWGTKFRGGSAPISIIIQVILRADLPCIFKYIFNTYSQDWTTMDSE